MWLVLILIFFFLLGIKHEVNEEKIFFSLNAIVLQLVNFAVEMLNFDGILNVKFDFVVI